jgi:hypothetical protein
VNYDLAIMALEGLTRSPLTVRVERGEVVIEGEAASFKELARLCLLIGGTQGGGEAVELRPAVHLTKPSPPVRLQLS